MLPDKNFQVKIVESFLIVDLPFNWIYFTHKKSSGEGEKI